MDSYALGGIVAFLFLGLVRLLWRRHQNLASILLVLGIAAASVSMLFVQVASYRHERELAMQRAVQSPPLAVSDVVTTPPAPGHRVEVNRVWG